MNNRQTGAQGFQGSPGDSGEGTQGAQGVRGFQGLQGIIGDQGDQGDQGNDGTQGITGSQGDDGITGNQGIIGAQGSIGSQGSIGAQGLRGFQGFQGTQGFTGSQGTQGSFNPALLSSYVPYTGATTSVDLGSRNITATNVIGNGGNFLTSLTAGTFGGNTIIGPTQSRTFDTKLILQGTASSDSDGPHITSYTTTDQYPITQILNKAHDDISINFDSYRDNTGWKSSHSGANYQIWKNSSKLFFSYSSGTLPGSSLAWGDSFAITSTGNLETYKPIIASDYVSTTRTISSNPHCYFGSQQPIASITYVANTPRIVALSSFIEKADPGNVFSSNGSGSVTYSGVNPVWFKIEISFNILPINAANTIFFWVNKNGIPTPSDYINYTFPTGTGLVPGYTPLSVSAVYQLSNGNSVQLGGQYSVNGNISIFDCRIIITPIS